MSTENMSAAEIKKLVLIEKVLANYGAELDEKGVGHCLFPEKHNNSDEHPSMQVRKEIVCCHSQGCFGKKGADVFDVVGRMENLRSFRDKRRRVLEIAGLQSDETQANRTIDAIYNYTDEGVQLLFQVVRYKPKAFRQRRPGANCRWSWDLKGVRRVLYHLPDVIKAKYILLLEGEKDVGTAHDLGPPDGWAETCNPMGAGNWRPEYSEMLRGKHVVIVPDADAAGERHAVQVAQALQGIAADIRTLTLPEGKDLSEWVELGGSAETFQSLLQGAQPWECQDPTEARNSVSCSDDGQAGQNSVLPPTRRRLDKSNVPTAFNPVDIGVLLARPVQTIPWVVPGFLAKGRFTLLGGSPKIGKTTLSYECVTSVASGQPWLGRVVLQAKVLILALEEHEDDVVRRLRETNKGDLSGKVQVNTGYLGFDKEAMDQIVQFIKNEGIGLVVVDTLHAWWSLEDENSAGAVNRAGKLLLDAVRHTSAAWLCLVHTRKSGGDHGEDIRGSTALVAQADVALSLKRTEGGPNQRYLSAVTRFADTPRKLVIGFGPNGYELLGAPDQVFAQGKAQKVLQALEEDKGKTLQELVAATGFKKQDISRALKWLGNQVTSEGKGVKGDPRKYRTNSIRPASPPNKSGCSDESNPEGDIRSVQAPVPLDESNSTTLPVEDV